MHTPGRFASAPETEQQEVDYNMIVIYLRAEELTSNAPRYDTRQKIMPVLAFHLKLRTRRGAEKLDETREKKNEIK